MERKRFEDQPCPVAQAVDVFGDWWVPMLLREAMYGVETFSEFQENLGISKNILNQRLKRLVELGVFEKVPYHNSLRHRYLLTEKGWDSLSILAAMMAWSDRWVFHQGDYPIELRDRQTGRRVRPVLIDGETGAPLQLERLAMAPGPGFPGTEEIRRWRFGEEGEVLIEKPTNS